MKCAILLTAYGVSSLQGESALKCFDSRVRERFPGIPVRWALTSDLLRERMVAERRKADSVRKALEKIFFERFTHVALQPLQLIPGKEYGDILEIATTVADSEEFTVSVGAPLLATPADVDAVARAVLAHLPEARQPDEDVVLMGHGAKHSAVSRYDDLAHAVYRQDARVHIGTLNSTITLDTILSRLQSRRVWLLPFLSVIGGHALRDMVGEMPSSWRSRIQAQGHVCVPVLKGSVEYDSFIQIWLDHLYQSLQRMAVC